MITKQIGKQLNGISELAALEESVGLLYAAYAEFFPDYQQFWSDLAVEEGNHAEWLRKLNDYVTQNPETFTKKRFNTVNIEAFNDYVNDEYGKLMDHKRFLINAFSITVYIQESLIERGYFEVFSDDCPEFKQTLQDLFTAHQNQLTQVREVFDVYKRAILQEREEIALLYDIAETI